MGPQKEKIKIVAISGSVRPDNNTLKVLNIVADEIKRDGLHTNSNLS